MNSVCKHLAEGLDVRKQIRVGCVERTQTGLDLVDEYGSSLGCFERLIVSVPAEQAAQILENLPGLAKPTLQIEMNPCWAAMISFDRSITDRWVGAFLHDSFLSWAARNNSKPGRNQSLEHLVLHACPEWTSANWERDPDSVASEMLKEFWRVSGIPAIQSAGIQGHRWKYAIPVDEETPAINNSIPEIAICGDWTNGARVEGAFLSGIDAANQIIESVNSTEKESRTPLEANRF